MYIKRILVIILLLGVVAMGLFSYFVYNTLMVPNTNFKEDKVYVYVKSGSSYAEAFQEIKQYLKDPEKFEIVARQKKYVQHVKAGRFVLTRDMTNLDIITALRSTNEPISLVFNNQDRLQNLAQRVSVQIEADSSSLMEAMTDSIFLSQNDFTAQTALNMYIPNKYQFYWNTSAKSFRDRMYKEYQSFWNDDRIAKAEALGLTPNEVQILASIVQKETARVDERNRVAGVYMNRLKRGMKLDADPTVIYALKNQQGVYDTTTIKRVLYKDLEIESPYNTYLNVGLPPGPIAMPDISSIDAVLNYEDHNFIFFVADPENPGYHKFAQTHNQHINNKRAYTNWLRKMKINR